MSFYIVGHRGSGRGGDENTVISSKRALSNGADALELDVQLVRGRLVLVHPLRPQGDMLDSVLAAVPTKTQIFLHLKRRRFSPRHDRRAIRVLAPKLKDRNVILLSFWPGTIGFAHRHYPKIATGFGTAWAWYDLLFSKRLRVKVYVSRHWLVSARMMARAKKRGVPIVVYTQINTPHMVYKLSRLGVDGVMTDDVPFWVRARAAQEAPGR